MNWPMNVVDKLMEDYITPRGLQTFFHLLRAYAEMANIL